MSDRLSDEAFIAGVLTRRCFAWLIDLVLIGLLVFALWLAMLLFGLLTLGLGWTAMAVLPLVPPLYHFLFLLRDPAATPGQKWTGLIVRRDADLGAPEVWQALVFTVLFYLTLATSGLLLLVALFTIRHRTLHDLLSGLVVVRRDAYDSWSPGGGGR